MLNFLKKKEPAIKIIDKVLIDETAKLKAMLAQWKDDKNIAFIFWFGESLQKAEIFFSGQTSEPVVLITTREAGISQLANKKIVFAEHYPLLSKEEELYQRMNLKIVEVFSSLDEPLFKQFGADKIIAVMKSLGVKEDEVIEHKMVTNAIRKAQEKIEKKVIVDQTAGSQADWLQKYYVS
jgi:hypothetical protein